MKTLIYAVDDEENIRELYSIALKSSGFGCLCFPDSQSLFLALKECKPSLILLDIMLNGVDGFEILSILKADSKYKNIPIIMVSAKDEEISKVKGLNLGANDYICKPFGLLELVARVKANLRKTLEYDEYRYLDIIIDDSKHLAIVNNEPIELTNKEYDLLKLLVANAPNVISRDMIINNVWNEDCLGETRTIDIHIASIRKAIINSKAKINTIRGVGYYLK